MSSTEDRKAQPFDVVNRAKHYNVHPSGVEAIVVCRALDFDTGNALKYVMRRMEKDGLRSLQSAIWYMEDAIRNEDKIPRVRSSVVPEFLAVMEQIKIAEDNEAAREFFFQVARIGSAPFDRNAKLAAISAIKTLIQEGSYGHTGMTASEATAHARTKLQTPTDYFEGRDK